VWILLPGSSSAAAREKNMKSSDNNIEIQKGKEKISSLPSSFFLLPPSIFLLQTPVKTTLPYDLLHHVVVVTLLFAKKNETKEEERRVVFGLKRKTTNICEGAKHDKSQQRLCLTQKNFCQNSRKKEAEKRKEKEE